MTRTNMTWPVALALVAIVFSACGRQPIPRTEPKLRAPYFAELDSESLARARGSTVRVEVASGSMIAGELWEVTTENSNEFLTVEVFTSTGADSTVDMNLRDVVNVEVLAAPTYPVGSAIAVMIVGLFAGVALTAGMIAGARR